MSGTLYGPIASPNVARSAVVAKELNIPLKYQLVDLLKGEHKQEPFISLNPFGAIPAYVSEDSTVTLFESRAIAKYLDFKTGGKLLHTKDAASFALVEVWASVESGSFSQAVAPIYIEKLVKPTFRNTPTDEAVVEASKPALKKLLEVYEKHLSKNAFLAGSELSVADLFHLPLGAAVLLKFAPDVVENLPHVKAWIEKLVALPSWQAVVKEQQELLAQFAKYKEQAAAAAAAQQQQ